MHSHCCRNEIHNWGGGAAPYIPSHSFHCYKGNILHAAPQAPQFRRPCINDIKGY